MTFKSSANVVAEIAGYPVVLTMNQYQSAVMDKDISTQKNDSFYLEEKEKTAMAVNIERYANKWQQDGRLAATYISPN